MARILAASGIPGEKSPRPDSRQISNPQIPWNRMHNKSKVTEEENTLVKKVKINGFYLHWVHVLVGHGYGKVTMGYHHNIQWQT